MFNIFLNKTLKTFVNDALLMI